jgi:hypothetical protein
MAAIDDNEQRDLEVIQQIKRRRLLELQKDQATFGRSTPPEVRTEIADLKRELGVVDPIVRGELSNDTLAALRQFGMPASLANAIQNFEGRLWDLKNDVRDLKRLMVVFMIALMLVGYLAVR